MPSAPGVGQSGVVAWGRRRVKRAPPSAACPASTVPPSTLGEPRDDGEAEAGADRSEAAVALVQHRRLEGDGEVVVGQARPAVAHLDDVDASGSRPHLDERPGARTA